MVLVQEYMLTCSSACRCTLSSPFPVTHTDPPPHPAGRPLLILHTGHAPHTAGGPLLVNPHLPRYPTLQEGTDVVLVQEYAEGGDLYRQLHKNGGRLSERQAVEMVLHPFLLALHYLHTRGIMHRCAHERRAAAAVPLSRAAPLSSHGRVLQLGRS